MQFLCRLVRYFTALEISSQCLTALFGELDCSGQCDCRAIMAA